MSKPSAPCGDFALLPSRPTVLAAADDSAPGACRRWRLVIVTTWARAAERSLPPNPNGSGRRPTKRRQAPVGECYFRKSFHLGTPEHGEVQIGCDDRYELYVNGRLVGSGKNWKVLDVYDITRDLVSGTNVIAVKAVNDEQGSAGLAARVVVKQEGGTHVTHSSDATWKTSVREFVGWQKARFNDSQWLAAREFGTRRRHAPLGQRSDGRHGAGTVQGASANSGSSRSSIPRKPAR